MIISNEKNLIECFNSRIHYTHQIAYLFRTLHENTLACDVIFVVRQHISCDCSFSNVNNGKERETTLLMCCLATNMTSHHARIFILSCKLLSKYSESVNENILSCFSHYLWINPRTHASII